MLLVAGALAGARSINDLVIEAFGEVGPAILHISGERDYRSLRDRVRRSDYHLVSSTDRIGAAYSAADLVLARAGSSVWEIAAAGKPAILVPYPFATGDHQAKNAEYFVRAGGAIMVRELDLDDVADRVRSLLDDAPRLERMSEAMLARREAGRGRRDRRRADRSCRPLAAGGSGSSGSAAPGCRPTRSSHAPGARRSAAGIASTTPYLEALDGIEVEISPEPIVPAGWEAIVSSAYPGVRGARAPSSWPSSSGFGARSSSRGRTGRARRRR